MFCYKCGAQITDSAAFCHQCGAKVTRTETTPSGGNSLNIDSTTAAAGMPEKSEAVIQSYSAEGTVNMKITVSCNGQRVGTIKKNESITVPISTDSVLEFKCAFRKASAAVKAGKRSELKLEFDSASGKLHVIDLRSGNSMEQLDKVRKGSKKWRIAGSILIGLCVMAMLIGWFMSDGGTNHVELVYNSRPLEDAGITATYRTVIEKYFTSPKWKERRGDNDAWYVDVSGNMAVDGETVSVTLTFKVTPEGNKYLADTFWIEAYGIKVDGESGGAEQASSFIIELFYAYDQKYGYADRAVCVPFPRRQGEGYTEFILSEV